MRIIVLRSIFHKKYKIILILTDTLKTIVIILSMNKVNQLRYKNQGTILVTMLVILKLRDNKSMQYGYKIRINLKILEIIILFFK